MRRRMAQRKQRKRMGTKKSTLSKRARVATHYTPIPCHVPIEKLVTLAELGLGVERPLNSEKRKWIACDLLTISDFTVASHLSSLDYINDINWEDFPNVKDWYSKIKSRPTFRPILADLLAGFSPPEHYNDLDF